MENFKNLSFHGEIITMKENNGKINLTVKAENDTYNIISSATLLDNVKEGDCGIFECFSKFKGDKGVELILNYFEYEAKDVSASKVLMPFDKKAISSESSTVEDITVSNEEPITVSSESLNISDKADFDEILFPELAKEREVDISLEENSYLINEDYERIISLLESKAKGVFKGTKVSPKNALSIISKIALDLAIMNEHCDKEAIVYGCMLNIATYTDNDVKLGSWGVLKTLNALGLNLLNVPESFQVAFRTIYDNKKYPGNESRYLYEALQAFKNIYKEGRD